ncbi:MAG: hypothetical protein GC179_11600 [Anaerolineaceae bacterium]|nr:hypothetical protein [Anaerolineaceae bacterium]
MRQYALVKKTISIALLVFVSCSILSIWGIENASSLFVNLPSFIEKTEIINSQNASPYKKAVCLTINQEALWEKTNTYDQLQNQLISTMKFKVDDNSINDFYLVTFALTVIRTKFDENDNVIGTYTDPYTACFDIKNIKAGIHFANFSLKSVSRGEHSFSWQFNLR